MRKTMMTAITAAFTLGLSGAAFADDKDKTSFEKLDKNGDGYVNREDIPADHELARLFASYDLDQDNRLSRSEFNVYMGASEVEESEE